jgi:hypothetical protein
LIEMRSLFLTSEINVSTHQCANCRVAWGLLARKCEHPIFVKEK